MKYQIFIFVIQFLLSFIGRQTWSEINKRAMLLDPYNRASVQVIDTCGRYRSSEGSHQWLQQNAKLITWFRKVLLKNIIS